MNKNSRTKNSMINLVTGFGGELLSSVILQFVVRTVFIATLGKSYLGINGLFSNILSMLSLANLGIGSAIVYRMYKPIAENDASRIRVLLKFYRLAYRIIGCVILVLGLCMIPLLPSLIKDYDTLPGLGINATFLFLLFLLRSCSSYLFLAYRATVITADQKRYIIDIITYVVHIITSIVQIAALVLFKDFTIYTVIAVGSMILNSLIIGIVAEKKYPQFFIPEKENLSKKEIKEMLQDCGALVLYKANSVVLKATDNIVLSAFIGLAAVGMYSNYLLLYRTFLDLIQKVFTAIRASMGNLFATESLEKQYRFFCFVNFLTALLFGTAGVGVAVCGNEVIEAWIGESYVLSQPVPILIGIELFFAGVIVNLGQVRGITGVFRQAWYRPLLGIVVNIAASVVLVQICGISGVLLGTIIANVTTVFLLDPRLIYKYSFQNRKPLSEYYVKNLRYMLICVAVAAVDMLICSRVFMGHGWFSVIVHIIITGVSVPAAFALLFWKTNECRYLVNMARGIGRRGKKRRSGNA